MKQNKLFTLACFSLLSLSGLASCSGNGNIPQKVDCYFRAQAATINEYGELVKVDFKDDECAEMTVEGKESLKYGEQDVVIHIKPKPFFTFKKYELDTWDPVGGAFHPYVGLGNPHSLYSYPLQENVAWTFEDLSTGAFNEEYKITVKKEFFQKNIVIDYGNAGALGNNVLTYNSSAYATAFGSALALEDQYYYDLDPKYCSFVSGSGGLTVTYRFRISNPLFTFNGWDTATEDVPEKSYKKYQHISVLASKTETNADPVELATYDPAISEKSKQLFVPTVAGDRISFYFDWSLLAEGKEGNYEPKYNAIKVKLTGDDKESWWKPSLSKQVNVNISGEHPEDVTIYPTDYCQYTYDEWTNKPAPQQLDIGKVSTYDTGDHHTINFENISVFNPDSYPVNDISASYGVLFEVPEGTEYFNCTLGNSANISVGPDYDQHLTDWRMKYYKDIYGETELPVWHSDIALDNSSWILVQLNPIVHVEGEPITRTANLDEEYQGGQNLYYLYCVNSEEITQPEGDYNIVIDVPHTPHATVKLDGATKQYGKFGNGKTSINISQLDRNYYDTNFIAYDAQTNFGVTVEVTSQTAGKIVTDARYEPNYTIGGEYSKIFFQTSSNIEDGDVFVITLLPKNLVRIAAESSGFCNFVDEGGDIIYEYVPTVTVTNGVYQCEFNLAIRTRGDYTYEYAASAKFDNMSVGNPILTPVTGKTGLYDVTIDLGDAAFVYGGGSLLEIKIEYAKAKLAEGSETFGQIANPDIKSSIGFSNIRLDFAPNAGYESTTFSVTVEREGYSIYPISYPIIGVYDNGWINIDFNVDEYLTNGDILVITLTPQTPQI